MIDWAICAVKPPADSVVQGKTDLLEMKICNKNKGMGVILARTTDVSVDSFGSLRAQPRKVYPKRWALTLL